MKIIKNIYYFLLDTVQTFLIAAAVFLVIYLFLFRPFEVKGESMLPTFYDKEYVLTNLIGLRFNDPKAGDVIVFKSPPDPNRDYIKRIIAVPGDNVFLKEGQVYINGKLLNETNYLINEIKTLPGSFIEENEEIKVPSNMYFVLGDNRTASSDSREWGFVKKDDIIGDSILVYWPIERIRLIKNPL